MPSISTEGEVPKLDPSIIIVSPPEVDPIDGEISWMTAVIESRYTTFSLNKTGSTPYIATSIAQPLAGT